MKQTLKKSSAKFKKGETIIEVLVALVIVTLGAATATTLIVVSLRANQFNKDSLVALNLAQEGVEYLHNLRDTNWLKFSGNTQNCWNTKPNADTCGTNNLLDPTTDSSGYALGMDADGQNTLIFVTKALDLTDGTDNDEEKYRLNYFDLNPSVNADDVDRGYGNGKKDAYDYIGSGFGAAAPVDKTKFYRSIQVKYGTIAGSSPWTTTIGAAPAVTADIMEITSTVVWMDSGVQHQANLSSALTRYK